MEKPGNANIAGMTSDLTKHILSKLIDITRDEQTSVRHLRTDAGWYT